jgi:hypothetical protein
VVPSPARACLIWTFLSDIDKKSGCGCPPPKEIGLGILVLICILNSEFSFRDASILAAALDLSEPMTNLGPVGR